MAAWTRSRVNDSTKRMDTERGNSESECDTNSPKARNFGFAVPTIADDTGVIAAVAAVVVANPVSEVAADDAVAVAVSVEIEASSRRLATCGPPSSIGCARFCLVVAITSSG